MKVKGMVKNGSRVERVARVDFNSERFEPRNILNTRKVVRPLR